MNALKRSPLQPQQAFFDYLNTRPLPGYQSPPLHFPQQQSPAKTLRPTGTGNSPLKPLYRRPPRPSDPVDPANRYEDANLPMNEHNRLRLEQNVTSYIRFFCGQVRGAYSLEDVEDLFARPATIPEDLHLRFDAIWPLLRHVEQCCRLAGIRVLQWFDILTSWKPKFRRWLTAVEFSLGLHRLCEEVNAVSFSTLELDLLFDYFQRHPDSNNNNDDDDDNNNNNDNSNNNNSSGDQRIVRRRDLQVGLKKEHLSRRRIQWLNHQARVVFKCESFLRRLRSSFRYLSGDVVRSGFKKMSITAIELGNVVSILIADYIIYVNCKHADRLLKQRDRTVRPHGDVPVSSDVQIEMMRRQLHSRGSSDGCGDRDAFSSTPLPPLSFSLTEGVDEDEVSVTSQLDIGDEMSTASLMDNMSETVSQLSARSMAHPSHSRLRIEANTNKSRNNMTQQTTSPARHHQDHNNPTATTTPHPHHHQTSMRERRRLDPLHQFALARSSSDIDIDFNEAFANHLAPEELQHLQQLVVNLKVNPKQSDASFDSGDDEVEGPSPRKVEPSPNQFARKESMDFMDERAIRSNAIVRRHSIMQRYNKLNSNDSNGATPISPTAAVAAAKGASSPTHKQNSTAAVSEHVNQSSLFFPKVVVDDWYLRDEEYKRAANEDPSLTPAAFKKEYHKFEADMHQKRTKRMKHYEHITAHFDRRVDQVQKRLNRAKKTGM
jgi:hypothetical protein